jgi:hypothetical protein
MNGRRRFGRVDGRRRFHFRKKVGLCTEECRFKQERSFSNFEVPEESKILFLKTRKKS